MSNVTTREPLFFLLQLKDAVSSIVLFLFTNSIKWWQKHQKPQIHFSVCRRWILVRVEKSYSEKRHHFFLLKLQR